MGTIYQAVFLKEMISFGYSYKIIASETGLPVRKLRKLYGNLENIGFCLFSKPGKTPSGATLIRNLQLKTQASLAMNIYFSLVKDSIYHSVNSRKLAISFYMYQALCQENEISSMFNINELWYLAQELRDGQALIERCEQCEFNYFQSIHQRMQADCPFCNQVS
ncbi:MAG: FlhC family transcriptional regulator [Candidatus Symbiodolus clandestinus]